MQALNEDDRDSAPVVSASWRTEVQCVQAGASTILPSLFEQLLCVLDGLFDSLDFLADFLAGFLDGFLDSFDCIFD